MRVWFGIGNRKASISLIIQPLRWQWSYGSGGGLMREVYAGPFTLQWWSK